MNNEAAAFIADPTTVLMAYMREHEIERDLQWGRLSMGLEVVTLIRTLEDIPVVNDAEREGTIATLATLLREQGLEDAYEVYEVLAEWRRVRFVSEPVAWAGVGDNGASSARASGGLRLVRRDRLDAPQQARRDRAQGDSAIGEQLALPGVGVRERRCE